MKNKQGNTYQNSERPEGVEQLEPAECNARAERVDCASILSFKNLQKSYGKRKILRNLSLDVRAGEIFGLVGHNGAGKTTLIRSIVGAQPIDGGSVFVCGQDFKKHAVECKSRVAYVPDEPNVYNFMTGIEFLNFMADMFNVSSDVREERIKLYASRFGLMDALGDQVSFYSHGVRQKLVLTSAFLHEPKLLVMDEPFVGLDPTATHELKLMMREIASRGSAVFFSSHVLEIVESVCDSVAVMNSGEIIAGGSVEGVVGDSTLEQVFLKLVEGGG